MSAGKILITGATGHTGGYATDELLENGHQILLIDKDPRAIKSDIVPNAE